MTQIQDIITPKIIITVGIVITIVKKVKAEMEVNITKEVIYKKLLSIMNEINSKAQKIE